MRREAAGYKRGRARRKGRKKIIVKQKKAVLGYRKRIKTNTETHPRGQYMKYLKQSLENSTFFLPMPRTMC